MKNVLIALVLFTIAGGALGAVASTTTKTVTPAFEGVQHTIYPMPVKNSAL